MFKIGDRVSVYTTGTLNFIGYGTIFSHNGFYWEVWLDYTYYGLHKWLASSGELSLVATDFDDEREAILADMPMTD